MGTVSNVLLPTQGLGPVGRVLSPAFSPQTWECPYDHSFGAQASVDYDHTAASVTLTDGYTWTQVGGNPFLDDLDVVNGAGLQPDCSNQNSAVDFSVAAGAATAWYLTLPLSDIMPDYAAGDLLFLEFILDDQGDQNDELLFVGFNSVDIETANCRTVLLGNGYAGAAQMMQRFRAQGAAQVAGNLNNTDGGYFIRFSGMGGYEVGYGVPTGLDFPTSYTSYRFNSFNETSGSSWDADTMLTITAQTNNVNDNYKPTLGRMRLFRARNSALYPYSW